MKTSIGMARTHAIVLVAGLIALLPGGCSDEPTPSTQGQASAEHDRVGGSTAQSADRHDGHDHEHGDDPESHDHDHASADHHAHDGEAHNHPEEEHAGDSHDDHDHGHEHEHEDGVVRLSPGELSDFGITIAQAGMDRIVTSLRLTGEVVASPDHVAHVVARAPGVVQEVLKSIGDAVEAGEPMAVLESAPLAEAKTEFLSRVREHALARIDLDRAETVYTNVARLLETLASDPPADALGEFADVDLGSEGHALISAYAQLQAARSSYERERSLFERRIGSEADFLEAQAAWKQALAEFTAMRNDLTFGHRRSLDERRRSMAIAESALAAAERRLHGLGLSEDELARVAEESDDELARYVVEAPIAGLVTQRHMVRGEMIEQGEQTFVVTDLSQVWVMLTVYQRDLPRVRTGLRVEVRAAHGLAGAEGVIDYISPILDEHTRTTTARVVLDNREGRWRPGLFVEATANGGDDVDEAVAVPIEAVQDVEGESVVFVWDGEAFRSRPVRIGRRTGDLVEVISGLDPGDRYAASGAFSLKAELNKASFEHAGHAH